jgi:hypothetical protein
MLIKTHLFFHNMESYPFGGRKGRLKEKKVKGWEG